MNYPAIILYPVICIHIFHISIWLDNPTIIKMIMFLLQVYELSHPFQLTLNLSVQQPLKADFTLDDPFVITLKEINDREDYIIQCRCKIHYLSDWVLLFRKCSLTCLQMIYYSLSAIDIFAVVADTLLLSIAKLRKAS